MLFEPFIDDPIELWVLWFAAPGVAYLHIFGEFELLRYSPEMARPRICVTRHRSRCRSGKARTLHLGAFRVE